MAYTPIDKSDDYFNINLWTGTGSTQSITGVNFQPDFLWVKTRSTAANHRAQNSVIGAGYGMNPNQTVAEGFLSDCVTSFDSDGFTLGADSQGYVNTSSRTYVGWSWLASNTTASNTDGSITSTVSANTTSGFSIVSYTGTGATATVGHGLGVTPKMIIIKGRSYAEHWQVYHTSLGATQYIQLSATGVAVTASTRWNDTEPTSSVFTIGNHASLNTSSGTLIAYCFADIKGFSKMGSYIGNGINGDGTFVYTGFKPSFILIKNADEIKNWYIYDTTRDTVQPLDLYLSPNLSDAEASFSSYNTIDALSNGFKLKGGSISNGSETNNTNKKYIYMAFAESPFTTSTGIPTTAR